VDTQILEQNLEALLKFATGDGKEKPDHVVFVASERFNVKSLRDATVL
jgi:hypothetical protein